MCFLNLFTSDTMFITMKGGNTQREEQHGLNGAMLLMPALMDSGKALKTTSCNNLEAQA